MKNILFVASECVPFVKTGGLADVVGSLPKYFNKKEYVVRVMSPKYACIPQEWKDKMQYTTPF
uniref:glycogen/starch synthase n=1 Tax=Jutongia sp. TaxID=2944204 RepID=UPI00308023BA